MPPIPNPLLPVKHSTEPAEPALAAESSAVNSLRLGNYTIGEGDCPELYGHPDIRY